MATADFGTVIHGTMRSQDLMPAFASALEALHEGEHVDLIKEAREFADTADWYNLTEEQQIQEQCIIEDLFDALDTYAPPYAYFGANEGDGTDYGFWLSSDAIDFSFEGLKVSDLSEVPDDYTGEVLLANDHGNLTLLYCEAGNQTTIWSLV